jgi:hypothetical protein
MAITISNVYIQTFERNLRHLAQQSDTRLRRFITEVASNGEKHNFELIGSVEASEKTSARTATPTSDIPYSRRVALASTHHVGETVEQEDIVQMLVDPNSNVTMSLAMAMRRKVDDIIIAAATGTALDGAGSSVAFDNINQKVGDGTGVITLDTIYETQEKFGKNDVDPDENIVMVIGPTQQRKLLSYMEVTSGDYQNAKALATGMLPNYMGFDWVVSNRLLSPSVGVIDCLAFTRKALGLVVNKDITAKVAEDPSLSFAWRLYNMMTMGAVRIEDKHLVKVQLKNAIS